MNLPCFDLTSFLEEREQNAENLGSNFQGLSSESKNLCEGIAECFRSRGCVVVRDPRVDTAKNDDFLDLMERYFGQPEEDLLQDARPQVHYQVGVTPEFVEVPRCSADPSCLRQIESMDERNRPTVPTGPDCKMRFFHRLGPRPAHTKYAELNAAPVIPKRFAAEWSPRLDAWGSGLLACVHTVAEALALGLGLPHAALAATMEMGPHLLAPTGTHLERHGQLGRVIAGWHYDLNLLTIHGRSRFPGLFVWLRDGTRVPVAIPEGCLLVQAGRQLEILTGGEVAAGYHEVVVTPETLAALDRARAQGRPPIRVSSTVFAHCASDLLLAPLAPFAERNNGEACRLYPPVPCGEFVQRELEAIALKKGQIVSQ